jgi:hypothetical protein
METKHTAENAETSAAKAARKLNPAQVYKKYLKNEDCNAHSENVVLLAENFGTQEDILISENILALHHELNHMPYPLSMIRGVINSRLYAILLKLLPANKEGQK